MTEASTSTKSITQESKDKQGVSWGVDGAVLATSAVIGSESSPTPQGASSFVQGAGSRSLPGAAERGGGGTAPPSLDTCDQVRKTSLLPCKTIAKGRPTDERAVGDRRKCCWRPTKVLLATNERAFIGQRKGFRRSTKGLSSEEIAKAHKDYKQALVDALRACHRYSDADLVARCGEDFKVGKCLDCGAAPAFPLTCDHRLCPDCAARRGVILVSEHEDTLKQLRYPKMLTLTFLSVAHLDKGFIRWARNCFTRLRRRKVMAGCWGGIYSFEVTHSVEYGWHLHIHALIGSGYIDQGGLSREWREISGACVVDIRAVQGKDKWGAVKEVVKYPTKAASYLGSPELVNEFLLATERVNLAYGFGAMYRVRTRRHAEAKMRCPLCGGTDISFGEGFGFCVPRIAVKRVKGGWLWRPPPYCNGSNVPSQSQRLG